MCVIICLFDYKFVNQVIYMSKNLAVIGVGNMAKAIISGIKKSNIKINKYFLYDVYPSQYSALIDDNTVACDSITEAIENADCILLSVKPQNFPEVLKEIASLPSSINKLYISIAAGITTQAISEALNTKNIVRVLPNIPMIISKGVTAVCYNDSVSSDDFGFVVDVFNACGSVIKINESDMNKTIGVTSSSPAYVFKFINAIYEGARSQGLDSDELLSTICDVIIGSAELIKSGYGTPENMVKAVASKGGTTEKALLVMEENNFDGIISDAMRACTKRADELGKIK